MDTKIQTKYDRYNAKNRENRLTWGKKRVLCETCGKTYKQSNKNNHQKTQRHKLMYAVRKTIKQMIIE